MSMLELRLKPATLVRYNLPDILYPMSIKSFDAALGDDAELDFGQMLYQLKEPQVFTNDSLASVVVARQLDERARKEWALI